MDPAEKTLRQAWHDLQEADHSLLQALDDLTGEGGFSPRESIRRAINQLTKISVKLDALKTQLKD
jgi:hypothetical protein